MKYYLRFSKDDYQSNIRGLIFESYAHVMLRDGGRFQARRLCGSNVASGQNVEVAFCPAKVRFFQAYEEIKLVKNVLWRLLSKNLPSIDSLCGPANFFQVTVSQTHPIKHQGLSRALDQTYRCQPYHAKDGKLFKGQLGNVREVEQWALMIPTVGNYS
ncbi:hypothetical protein Pst134EA_004688 [Puccinia striiformis f. sp. tritici]|uniref:Uncharacterized protein n=1 Tax=Puccinia striiformis f. sp. tritici PST-78 TaxID=1165861 RepID=A0A0L0VUG4_9BASI|nr:hypothetical protein Pst134EA_004688 [Puccinia striiformis f. sp. tritici]KAH9470762.1 hypothetical protein Pst134EA_004688 [Puccinia striiformis f. sp. tritici]KAI9613428.1 hypothetical protein H4Q26_010032 [Puccinia striiformis f. sp. tritici PST-130]KNF02625.1 hypothetical protein PSTG_04220 [Puccinia striiformis f. sp. tritici PST-78]